MERYQDHRDDELIDFGSVTSETRGAIVGFDDHDHGLDLGTGLSDD